MCVEALYDRQDLQEDSSPIGSALRRGAGNRVRSRAVCCSKSTVCITWFEAANWGSGSAQENRFCKGVTQKHRKT